MYMEKKKKKLFSVSTSTRVKFYSKSHRDRRYKIKTTINVCKNHLKKCSIRYPTILLSNYVACRKSLPVCSDDILAVLGTHVRLSHAEKKSNCKSANCDSFTS